MADVDEPFAPLRAAAAAPMWFRLAFLVIGWLMIAAPCMAMPGEPDPQREVCRRVAMSPEEYGALADEIRRLPPKAIRGEDEESHVAAFLRERLQQVLAGRGTADQQIAAILGLIRTIEAEVGLAAWEPARRDQALAWLTLKLLAAECGDGEDQPVQVESADQDAIASRGSSDQKLAAMHAVLRSIGAEFAWARVGQSYEDSGARRVPAVWYHYRIDVNRLRVLRPLFRWGRIDVSFYTDESWQTIGDLRHVAFHIAVPFSPSISGLKKDIPQTRTCPPVPAEAERPVHHQGSEQEGAEPPSGGRHDG